MERPSHNTVEALLAQLDVIAVGGKQKFELWVPQHLAFRGQLARLDVAMAVILDKILSKGYELDGFTEEESGKVYSYKIAS
jgi:hypothetical protein